MTTHTDCRPTAKGSIASSAGFLLAVMLVGGSPSFGHQDMIFPISSTGELAHIPDIYGPVSVRVHREDSSDRSKIVSVIIRIGEHRVDLPSCVSQLFSLPAGEEIHASGSWYHDRSSLPPYLNLALPRRTVHIGWFDGYSLLFNLETAELIEINENILGLDERSMQRKNVELSTLCTSEEIDLLAPKPVFEDSTHKPNQTLDSTSASADASQF